MDSGYLLTTLKISIHTPARGVTDNLIACFRFRDNFNPHSRKGSDKITSTGKIPKQDFNPHSRKGSDNYYLPTINIYWYFNPHSRKGSDLKDGAIVFYDLISIHTPARGVTLLCLLWKTWNLFQSTLPQGE